MSFYLINRDPDSPIRAIKSSSLDDLELVFKEKESVKIFSECLDDKSPFTFVWQEGNALKIKMKASLDHSIEGLCSPLISERHIEILLATLVNHYFLKQAYKQVMFHELTHHFAKMRLVVLQAQAKGLAQQLIDVDSTGSIDLNSVGATEKLPITSESKKNILTSVKQLKQMMECVTKMMAEKKIITKEEIMLFRSFRSSCFIKTESELKGWFADQGFADAMALFVRDFDKFLIESHARSLSVGASRFALHKPSSDQRLLTPEDKLPWKTCPIL